MTELELDLYNDMLRIYKEADRECNYRPTIFREMLIREGGLKTAKSLISKNAETTGFTKLLECSRLDLSVEALVAKDKYKELFTDKEIKSCKDKLKKHGFDLE